jgi:5-formyltetrahydrofolate cyclo-ligase
MNIVEEKAALRRQVHLRLEEIDAAQRKVQSFNARKILLSQPVWAHARSILFFAPRSDELDLWPLVEMAFINGKKVALPRYEPSTGEYEPAELLDPSKDLLPGRYGIAEPGPGCAVFPVNQLDLVLVPGVAFDLLGRRLGRGKGHYDKMLAAPHGIRCGVGYDQQIVPEVPVAPHDAYLTCILTPTRWMQL